MMSIGAELVGWFKRFVPTSDPDNLRTPPLPLEELYRYSPQHSPAGSQGSVQPDSHADTFSSGVVSPDREDTPKSSRRGRKRRAEVAERGEASTSFMVIPARKKRQYNKKSEEEKKDPKYQAERARGNAAVENSRLKKKAIMEEMERQNKEEKLLMISTFKKVLEQREWDSVVAEKTMEGLVIPPGTLPEANVGVMNGDQWNLYERVRSEVRKEMESRVLQFVKLSNKMH